MKTNFLTSISLKSWLIILLILFNISTLATILYRCYTVEVPEPRLVDQRMPPPPPDDIMFKRLDLSDKQVEEIAPVRQIYLNEARKTAKELQHKRFEMLDELALNSPDSVKLNQIAREIGDLHYHLKHVTFMYYLKMKAICSDEQQKQLLHMFKAMLDERDERGVPRGKGRQHHGGRQ